MVRNSRQAWTVGQQVKIGFLTLRITGIEPTPGDYRPDAYHLVSLDGARSYRFVPHCGLERIELVETQ